MKKLIYITALIILFVACKENNVTDNGSTDNQTKEVKPGNLITDVSLGNIPDKQPRPGDFAPNFILNEGTDKELDLRDYRGKVVFLEFWRTTCHFCRASIPDLVKNNSKINDDDFVIIGISVDKPFGYSEEDVKSFIKDYNMSDWINIYEGSTYKTSVSNQYQIPGTPASYLIDKEGKIVSNISGHSEQFIEQVQEQLDK